MSRKPPDTPLPDLSFSSSDRKLFELNLKVITPMFGGSAEAGVVDPNRPVSAKSIRGHLRFWWRACKAGRYGNAQELFKAEEAIWGSTESPSLVDLVVNTTNRGRLADYVHYRWNDERERYSAEFLQEWPRYALFPFQGEAKGQNMKPAKQALLDVEFTVAFLHAGRLSEKETSDVRDEVLAAVWAWVLFGGVGARTRRGCGSLYCTNEAYPGLQFPGRRAAPGAAIEARPEQLIVSPTKGLAIPCLAGAVVRIGPTKNCISAWQEAVELMRNFRQGEDYGRNAGDQTPGRSKWPEPDSIRDGTGCHYQSPNKEHRPEHAARPFYPRADLGLPIVFHFKDKDRYDSSKSDPGDPDPILAGAEKTRTRMASPIILKPLAISADQACAIALCLSAPHVWDDESPGVSISGHILTRDRLTDHDKSTNVVALNAHKSDSAREAFMALAKKTLTTEVKL